MDTTKKDLPWEGGKCRVAMWQAGCPAGLCGEAALGPQLPRELLASRNRYLFDRPPLCVGPCCPNHGGPNEGEPILFQDGLTDEGRRMWCAVMPGFVNLQESPAGFDGDGRVAVRKLHEAIALQKVG